MRDEERAFGDCGGGGCGKIFPKEGRQNTSAEKFNGNYQRKFFISEIHCVCIRVLVLEARKRRQTLATICAVLRDEINVAPIFWGHAF